MHGFGYWVEKRRYSFSKPTSYEPVKVTPATSGCRARASPATRPGPVIRLHTPGGNPARSNTSWILKPDMGVSDDGLSTTVLPATSAAAAGAPSSAYGKFQGAMTTQTP